MLQRIVIEEIKNIIHSQFGINLSNEAEIQQLYFFESKVGFHASDLVALIFSLESRYNVKIDQKHFLSDAIFTIGGLSLCLASYPLEITTNAE